MQMKATEEVEKMPSAFSYNDLGIFCKMEYLIQQKVPIMIRLGTVRCTEEMEGKGQNFPDPTKTKPVSR